MNKINKFNLKKKQIYEFPNLSFLYLAFSFLSTHHFNYHHPSPPPPRHTKKEKKCHRSLLFFAVVNP